MRFHKLMALALQNQRVFACFDTLREIKCNPHARHLTLRLKHEAGCISTTFHPRERLTRNQKQNVNTEESVSLRKRTKEEIKQRLQHVYESQHEETLKRLQEIEDKIQRMAEKLETLSHITEVQMKINKVNLSYVPGKLVKQSRTRDFRKNLLDAYGYTRFIRPGGQNMFYCPVVGRQVPASELIAGHVFKHEWGTVCKDVLGLHDIDSIENGLMMYSPVEYCFDRLQLCFLMGDNGDFFCRVLDPGLLDKTLVAIGKKRKGRVHSGCEDGDLCKVTYGDIDGRILSFMTGHRPSRDAINFHARQARINAISKGWVDKDWDFPNFYTDDARWQKMLIWIEQKLPTI